MSERVTPDVLRTLFLFEGLPEDQPAWLSTRADQTTYDAGLAVFRKGNRPSTSSSFSTAACEGCGGRAGTTSR